MLVAGVDSSTQACKVVVCDTDTGADVREGRAQRPPGTEVDPYAWEHALHTAVARAGGLDDVAALSVGGQQHGMVCLSGDGAVVRPALLWNDTRSAPAALDQIAELGGPAAWADAVGSVPVVSFTVSKLRWLRDDEPEHAARVLAAAAAMLAVDLDTVSDLALKAAPGADGVVLVPHVEGERTPNRPDATGSLHGLTLATATPHHLARAAVEGLLCGLADGIHALRAAGVEMRWVLLIGGGARSQAVREIAPTVFGTPVAVPAPGEYVALGAARQAAWALAGTPEPPAWAQPGTQTYDGPEVPAIRENCRTYQ